MTKKAIRAALAKGDTGMHLIAAHSGAAGHPSLWGIAFAFRFLRRLPYLVVVAEIAHSHTRRYMVARRALRASAVGPGDVGARRTVRDRDRRR
jgi:hypothetical protein